MRNRIPRFDALPLSHRDSTVSEVYYEVLFTNITLSTLLILAVRRTRVIWTSSETSLTMESLWLSGRASESGIRRSEVRFVIGTQKFSLSHARDKTKIIFISLPSSSTQDRGHSFFPIRTDNEGRDVLGGSRKRYRCLWPEIGKYGPLSKQSDCRNRYRALWEKRRHAMHARVIFWGRVDYLKHCKKCLHFYKRKEEN